MTAAAGRIGPGLLIVNADDLGGNPVATDRIVAGFRARALTSDKTNAVLHSVSWATALTGLWLGSYADLSRHR